MPSHTNQSHHRNRAVGAVIASACGDALGAPYEFKPSLPDSTLVVLKAGGGWGLGEWTDDTSMAMPILHAAARRLNFGDDATLGALVRAWLTWSTDAKDVGIQTRKVLDRVRRAAGDAVSDAALAELARTAAREVHDSTGRSGGNGSLMRTGPLALAYLEDPRGLAAAARAVSDLTHVEEDAGDACVIWSLAIRQVIITGELDIRGPIDTLPANRRERWHARIDVAESLEPRDIPGSNGWVVAALQAAWSAIVRGDGLVDTLERAVRCGNDTDTVAAIAGALAGARHGVSAIPFAWQRRLHGWPGWGYDDLVGFASLAFNSGRADISADLDAGFVGSGVATEREVRGIVRHPVVRHPHDAGVWLGDLRALDTLPEGVDAVVSLSRVGVSDASAVRRSDRAVIWILDSDDNLDVDGALRHAADAVAVLRSERRVVLLHCVEAHSRTPTVAAAYAVRHLGIDAEKALADVLVALPGANPRVAFREALLRVAPS
ncbi:ADP-ribosylglycohydrolase family protein [Microbacterium sp. HA-8]|uniref:ADP-ribosylglycohydrolase family protein n=1 Tax=Microbacterium sp. HA-8 TaxID=3234200 RepID=UPI0038F64577